MTGKNFLKVVPFIVVTSIIFGLPAASPAAEFTADLIRITGSENVTSKVFVKGKMRREEVLEDGEVAAINIARIDKGVSWTLMPDEKMYMEMPLEGMRVGAMEDIEEIESRTKMKLLGKETVNGFACEKRQYEDATEGIVTVWFSPKLNYPVRINVKAFGADEEMTMDYRNIKTGTLEDSLFEVPKGFQKFGIPGMPAGMPGMPGMGR